MFVETVGMAETMDEKDRILAALSDPQYSWRTIEGVSRSTGIPAERVLAGIESMPDLVIRSSVPNPKGQPLYATRTHYRETHSVLERFADQIRGTST